MNNVDLSDVPPFEALADLKAMMVATALSIVRDDDPAGPEETGNNVYFVLKVFRAALAQDFWRIVRPPFVLRACLKHLMRRFRPLTYFTTC